MPASEKNKNQIKFDSLRKEYPYMEYIGFQSSIDQKGLLVTYEFNLAGKYTFRPEFFVPVRRYFTGFPSIETINSPVYQNLLFHIGLIEMISYWKCACPPKVIIRPFKLNTDQVNWWKNVYYQGLGEFFYTNNIHTTSEKFMQIHSEGEELHTFALNLDDTIIVPIGGGKDSVVTLELLKKTAAVRPFILNPRGATLECARVSGFGNDGYIEVNRQLDAQLLRLNEQGFLNGHTPFSALLAFYSLLIAAVSGHRHIALSNESSANEPTVAGTQVNHQYSKSFSFESDFRDYVTSYISADFNYFSFLRPLNELQIARLFSAQVKYYPAFKSCNAGSKTDEWCCNCPKCLFAFTILSPFIPTIELVHIFGKNLFEQPEMIPYFKELTGIEDVKPFECVGTIEEVNAALLLYIQKNKFKKLPLLLDYYSNTTQFETYSIHASEKLLLEWNHQHFLQPAFIEILEQAMA